MSKLPTPRLASPWQWAYIPPNTTSNPSARVLAPINQETQEIHPSFYRRFPSALASMAPAPEKSYSERMASRREASHAKCEKWLAVDEAKVPQGGLEQLGLDSDEEGREKVNGDEDWEFVDSPGVEEGKWAE